MFWRLWILHYPAWFGIQWSSDPLLRLCNFVKKKQNKKTKSNRMLSFAVVLILHLLKKDWIFFSEIIRFCFIVFFSSIQRQRLIAYIMINTHIWFVDNEEQGCFLTIVYSGVLQFFNCMLCVNCLLMISIKLDYSQLS